MKDGRMGIAASLAGGAPAEGGGQVVESKQHEQGQEGMMAEILGAVKDIQQKLDALMGSEGAEKGSDETADVDLKSAIS